MDFQKDDGLFLSTLYTAAHRSHHHQHRVGFAVTSRDDALREIQLRLDGDKKAACVDDIVANQANGKIVFVFSGMGTQWWGMARNLMQSSDVFVSNIKVSHSGGVYSLETPNPLWERRNSIPTRVLPLVYCRNLSVLSSRLLDLSINTSVTPQCICESWCVVAKWLRHLHFTQKVMGSIPAYSPIFFSGEVFAMQKLIFGCYLVFIVSTCVGTLFLLNYNRIIILYGTINPLCVFMLLYRIHGPISYSIIPLQLFVTQTKWAAICGGVYSSGTPNHSQLFDCLTKSFPQNCPI